MRCYIPALSRKRGTKSPSVGVDFLIFFGGGGGVIGYGFCVVAFSSLYIGYTILKKIWLDGYASNRTG